MIYYYIDRHGIKQGSFDAHKIHRMAEQNYAGKIEKCPVEEFDGHLHSSEWID